MLCRVLLFVAFLALALPVAPAWGHRLPGPELGVDPVETAFVSPETGSPPDTTILLEPELAATEGSLIDAVEVNAILAVAIGLAGLAGAWWRDRRTAIARVTTALVLGFIVETTPHLVHHSLDADQGAGCEALQTAERSQAAVGAIDPPPVLEPADLAATPLIAAAPTCAAPSPRGRAPPA